MAQAITLDQLLGLYEQAEILLQDVFIIRQQQLRATFEDLVDRVPNHRASILVQIKWGNVFQLAEYWQDVLANVLELPVEQFKKSHRLHLQRLAYRSLIEPQSETRTRMTANRLLQEALAPKSLEEEQTILANRISTTIANRGLTIRKAANLTGIHYAGLWRYSKGLSLPGHHAWQAIEHTLQVDISDLPLVSQAIATRTTRGRQPIISPGRS